MTTRRRLGRLMTETATMEMPSSAAAQRAYRATGTALRAAYFGPISNGRPTPKAYTPGGDDSQLALLAWHKVATLQASLRGEPEPPFLAEPWNLKPCKCGFSMRCGCAEEAS